MLDNYDANVIKQFIEANWSDFESHCSELDTDAEVVIAALDSFIDQE